MRYLTYNDLVAFKSDDILSQLVANIKGAYIWQNIFNDIEDFCIEELINYLNVKYDLSFEINRTNSNYISAEARTTPYVYGERVYTGRDTKQQSIRVAKLPAEYYFFSSNKFYTQGQKVFVQPDKLYTAISDSVQNTHFINLQLDLIVQRDLNELPGEISSIFQSPETVNIPANTPITDDGFFTGDDRNKTIVRWLCSMFIYKLYSRISLRELPEDVAIAYNTTMRDIKASNSTPNLILSNMQKRQPQGKMVAAFIESAERKYYTER